MRCDALSSCAAGGNPSAGFLSGAVLGGMFPPGQVPGEDLEALVLMWLLLSFLGGERAFVWYVKIILVLYASLELPKNTLPAGVSNSMVSERIPSLLRRGRGG